MQDGNQSMVKNETVSRNSKGSILVLHSTRENHASRVVIEMLTNSTPTCLNFFEESFVLNLPQEKEFGSKVSRGDALLRHFLECKQVYKMLEQLVTMSSIFREYIDRFKFFAL